MGATTSCGNSAGVTFLRSGSAGIYSEYWSRKAGVVMPSQILVPYQKGRGGLYIVRQSIPILRKHKIFKLYVMFAPYRSALMDSDE